MKNMKWTYMIVAALLLVASSAVAQKVPAGDDGLTTPGGGRTQVDLSGYPIEKIFGARVDGNPVISLKGESLGTGPLDGIDTIVRREKDIDLSSGSGSGPLAIVALRLVSENPVSIGGNPYAVHVFLSEFRDDIQPGTLSLKMANVDGGTFDSFFTVRPKLVFTGRDGKSMAIDCGAVVCGDGSDLTMRATGASFTLSSPGGMDPKAKGIKTLAGGLAVDGDGDGVAELTTRPSTNLFIGVIPSRPTFPIGPVDKYKQAGGTANHGTSVPVPAISAAAAAKASSTATVNGTFTPVNNQ